MLKLSIEHVVAFSFYTKGKHLRLPKYIYSTKKDTKVDLVNWGIRVPESTNLCNKFDKIWNEYEERS